MNKLRLGVVLVAVFSACSTATLINFNVDGDSFIPASSKSTSLALTAGASINTPVPDGGIAVPLPNLSFLTAARVSVRVAVVSSTPGAVSGQLELFVAPANTADLYAPANKVPTSTNCTTDATVNGVDPVDFTLNLTSTSPADCATAFNRIQSGQFKIGARVSGSVTADTTVTFTILNLDVGVSGYPVKLIP
ncbi:MAG: hypothetical protein ACK41E_08010 [Deinococcales bacterium]